MPANQGAAPNIETSEVLFGKTYKVLETSEVSIGAWERVRLAHKS